MGSPEGSGNRWTGRRETEIEIPRHGWRLMGEMGPDGMGLSRQRPCWRKQISLRVWTSEHHNEEVAINPKGLDPQLF